MKLLILVLTLTLVGCGLTPKEQQRLGQILGAMNHGIESAGGLDSGDDITLPTTHPQRSTYSAPQQPASRYYLINQDAGLQQRTCTSLSSGYSYCL